MANSLTAHTIVNGSRNLIIQYNLVADGSGNYSDFKLLDLNNYQNEGERIANDYSIIKVSGRDGAGASFKLKFGSSVEAHKLFFESTIEDEFYQSWADFGGISPKLTSSDLSVRISTTGFDAANDAISLVIWLKKKNDPASD